MEERAAAMISLRIVPLVLLALMFISCSDNHRDAGVPGEMQEPDARQSAPDDSSISIGPDSATARSIILLKTGNMSINAGSVHWYINGEKDDSASGMRYSSDRLKKGDIVYAVIMDGLKEYRSNEISIINSPPFIFKANISPQRPRVTSTLKVDIKAEDFDNDHISYRYKWTYNGRFAGEDRFLDREFRRGDTISVEVTPFDGKASGRGVKLDSMIFNSLPAVIETDPVFDGKVYQYQVSATDPDGDSLIYKIHKGPEGMSIGSASGIVKWEVTESGFGTHEFEVLISDGNGGELIVPLTVTLGLEEKNNGIL
jgi:hypothetical protein